MALNKDEQPGWHKADRSIAATNTEMEARADAVV